MVIRPPFLWWFLGRSLLWFYFFWHEVSTWLSKTVISFLPIQSCYKEQGWTLQPVFYCKCKARYIFLVTSEIGWARREQLDWSASYKEIEYLVLRVAVNVVCLFSLFHSWKVIYGIAGFNLFYITIVYHALYKEYFLFL